MPNTVRISKTVKRLEYACYILLICVIIPIRIDHHNLERDLEYDKYLEQFNKTLENVQIYQQRREVFQKALDGINQYNKNRTNVSALYGLTKFSDVSPQDFLKNYLMPNISQYRQISRNKIPTLSDQTSKRLKVPMKIDWRQNNVVTKIENQGTCGACWAFATIGITESMYAIKTGKLETFSKQEMIDCAKNNDGCNGGDVYLLLDWLKTENITIVNEEEYPTQLGEGLCRTMSPGGIKIKDFECGNFVKSEELIIELLANYGPVAVAINALSWQNYVSGVIQFHCDDNPLNLNHAVQIVGYDMTVDIPYYIIRNSWGEDFGDDGYLYIAVGGNVCGLAEEVCIVEL